MSRPDRQRKRERSSAAAARVAVVVLATVWMGGCGWIEAVGVRSRVQRLTDAGFDKRPADTIARKVDLASLPQHRVFRQVRNGAPVFVYADANVTGSFYLGGAMAYALYERAVIRRCWVMTELLEPIDSTDSRVDWRLWDPVDVRR